MKKIGNDANIEMISKIKFSFLNDMSILNFVQTIEKLSKFHLFFSCYTYHYSHYFKRFNIFLVRLLLKYTDKNFSLFDK